MSSTVMLKAIGLHTSPNQLNLPEGALTEATNVIIKRDNVIESRRGYKLYGTELPDSLALTKQLFEYRQRIIRHYSNKLEFDSDGNGTFVPFSGTYLEAEDGIRIKTVESNGNLYFTTADGIKKLSSKTADGLAETSPENSGAIKAVDLLAFSLYNYANQSGFLISDSTVAYRVVWAKKDNNNNLLRGTPSQRAVVVNSLEQTLIQDFNRVLVALDNIKDTTDTARISDGDYMSTLGLSLTAGAFPLHTNIISLAAKLDTDIVYARGDSTAPIDLASGTYSITGNVATITKGGGADFTDYFQIGSEIELSGFTTDTVFNDKFTVSSVSASQIQFNLTNADILATANESTMVINSNEYRAIPEPSVPATPAINDNLLDLQFYMDAIIQRLQSEPPIGSLTGIVISSSNQTDYIQALDITTSSTVELRITIPDGVTTDHFIQVYRSDIAIAQGSVSISEVSPSDELKLVYEQYPTSSEITSGEMIVIDSTPDEFLGENLYTNASTGEGIANANDVPPFAKDVNRFKNVIFYANTRTRQRFQFQLLGVQKMIEDYNLGTIPKVTITDGTNVIDYTFVVGKKEITELTVVADSSDSLNGVYFDKNSANDYRKYRFYYKTTGAADTPPASGGRSLQQIVIPTNATATQVAEKTRDVINALSEDFTSSSSTDVVTITNYDYGYSEDLDLQTSGFSFTVTQQGIGELVDEGLGIYQVLLSDDVSPAKAVDATARSFVRVVNKNNNDIIYGYYLSSPLDVPGKVLFETKNINAEQFFIIANNDNTGISFNPDISPEYKITNIDAGTDIITIGGGHTLTNGDQIYVTLTDVTPAINGLQTVVKISSTEIKLTGVDITAVASTDGNITLSSYAQFSENEEKQNRIYYSKFQQPEAVPIVNYFDVGAEDKPIYRIFPLRDSLFVFKEDGLYRVSGETAPFSVQLFDSSTILIADDSVSVANNYVYCWTTQGISVVSESNVDIISRPIDVDILPKGSSQYTNFRYATWGVGYESDNSYAVYTPKRPEDTLGTIGYKYSNLTNSWTTVDKVNTCGIILSADDKKYMGAGDVAYIEQERKNFDRTDYADREYPTILGNGKYSDYTMIFPDISFMKVGDVLTQVQTLTIYEFNMVLRKLDLDSGAQLGLANGDPTGYFSALKAVKGDNLRSKLVALATRLDSDPGITTTSFVSSIAPQNLTITDISENSQTTITTSTPHGLIDGRYITITGSDSDPVCDGRYSIEVVSANEFKINKKVYVPGTTGTAVTLDEDFEDIKVCYNNIMTLLNLDSGISFSNYRWNDTYTTQEVIIKNINTVTREVTVNLDLDMVSGPLTVFKSIKSAVTYAPNTMGDPLGIKHLREATLVFENKAFTSAVMEFSTDLLPQFEKVPFDLDGNGIFGHQLFGSGFFGGGSHGAPFRTYIPRNCQRCIYMRVRFSHGIAREKFSIFATTITGNIGLSTRGYR